MLDTVDLSLTLDDTEYDTKLVQLQVAMNALGFQVYQQQRPVVMVFEGWDAGGKGGAIRRVTEKLDPRGYAVYPTAAPKGDEGIHHYLWRFWNRIPEAGQIAIFDRSWYGRVMVERIEGFCTEDAWKRAYREINQFERQMVDFGTILFKFWIHISPEEQLARFESRAGDRRRRWKLTDEDWRNREKQGAYTDAVNEMLLRTSTVSAPWTVVEGNSKNFARVKILQTLVDKLSGELNSDPARELSLVKDGKRKKDKKKKGKKKQAEKH